MKKYLFSLLTFSAAAFLLPQKSTAQINVLQDYKNNTSAAIGTFQLINFREGGFSGLFPVPNTNGKEFWTCSDRGVNVDAANANPAACRPTYDKIYGFPGYAPKIHRIRLAGDSVQILQTITMKRPGGTAASGLLNPAGFGSTASENVSTDTVLDCTNFPLKLAAKDIWGIDAEGIVVDKNGYFWICEEGGATIWKLNPNGVVVNRFTPFANAAGAQPQDIQIDSVFGYRKNNRGFEGISITPGGKIYAIIQSPIFYPSKSVGEASRIHRILEIDPATNITRMFAYLNDGIIGASGSNQIRLRDWKIGDMAAINDSTFLVLEAALRGTTDIKRVYQINIKNATPVTSGLYGGVTLEALVDATGLTANNIAPVTKTLFMDLLANGWSASLEKAEGIAIINDSTIAIGNDNDYGQISPAENGVATATGILSHVYKFGLQGSNKLTNFSFIAATISQGITGPSSSQTPYLVPSIPNISFTSIITANDAVGGYKLAGIPDGLGAYDNGNGTFTLLANHEIGNTLGIARAHGSKGAFVSKWVINKSDLSVVSGEDLMKKINLWNTTTSTYIEYSAANPSILAAFSRFCSADLPAVSAFYNSATGLGTQERIFMDGEESGAEGRAVGHIATGPNAGTSYELPYLGKFSWENAVANPATGDKTVVAGMDDATPGQVYFYIGTKTNSGTEIEKAGLSNGKLYGPVVSGLTAETSASIPPAGTTFTMADLGSVQNITGAALQANSVSAGVTQFLRPEDGSWDPSNPGDFYFNTTNAFGSPSRLWKLHFTNISDLTQGGTITAVLDGTEGQQMLDNLTIDNSGHMILQEDVGNNTRVGKIWQYNIATDSLFEIAAHDSTRFLTGGANFLTQDEESSGVIDASAILGPGMFLTTVQAHYSIPGEAVEGGQLLAFYNPYSINKAPLINITNPIAGNPYNAGSNISFNAQATDADGVISKVEFFNNGNKIGEDSTAPYSYNGQSVEAGSYMLTAKATDNNGATAVSNPVSITVTGCTPVGNISAEGYNNIAGSQVADLTSNPAFPGSPTVLASLQIFEYGTDLGSDYGARVRGYICAPQTGNYTFYIAADDQAGLWLSTDENPANKVLIAFAESYTNPREWFKYPTQKSVSIKLVKGVRYYIETLHKELNGTDHLAVAWTLPDGFFEGPVQGNRLSPWASLPAVTRTGDFNKEMKAKAVENNILKGLKVTATPNPSPNEFIIVTKSSSDKPLNIVVTDVSGRIIERKSNVAANGTLRIGNKLPAGIYLIEVMQGTQKERLKLMKQ
jgi:Esterase-like activity of phytase/Bacterial Ig domain/PA14 domain/Secretion system C-terminal sorting domain/Bacterial protein of unknown function (DUF839)